MNLTYKQVYQSLKTLSDLGDTTGTPFALWLLNTLPKLGEVASNVESALNNIRQDESFQAYLTAERALHTKYFGGDSQKQLTEEESKSLEKEVLDLRAVEQYKNVVENYQKELAKIQELTKSNETVEVEVEAISKSELPATLTANQIIQFEKLIK